MRKRIYALFIVTFLICNIIFASQLVHFINKRETQGTSNPTSLNTPKSANVGVLYVLSGNYPAHSTWAKKGDVISFQWYTEPVSVVDFWIMDEADWQKRGEGYLVGNKYLPSFSGSGDFIVPHDDKWYLMFCHPSTSPTYLHYSITTTDFLMISSPNSETTTLSESSLNVNWRTNYATWIKLDLYKGTSFITTLRSHMYNDGSASIQIPWDCSDGDNYKIKISDKYSDEFDFSEPFTIQQRKITMILPMENDVYVPHTTRIIGWNSLGVSPSTLLSINLYLNSTHIFEISNQTKNDGDYEWQVKTYRNKAYSHYQIRIQEASTQKYISLSPLFTITKEKSMNPSDRTNW